MHEIDRLIASYKEAGLARVIRNTIIYLWVTFSLVVLRKAPSMTLPQERELIKTLLCRQEPKVAVEIGTAKGGTLQLLCRHAAEDALIISVDLPNGVGGGGYPKWMGRIYDWVFRRRNQRLELLRGDSGSLEMRDKVWFLTPPKGIEFLWIDGDHSYDGVKRDFETYRPLMAERATIIFHDIQLDGQVGQLWSELKQEYGARAEEFIYRPEVKHGYGIGMISLGQPFEDNSWLKRYEGFNRVPGVDEADNYLRVAVASIVAFFFIVFAATCSVWRWLT